MTDNVVNFYGYLRFAAKTGKKRQVEVTPGMYVTMEENLFQKKTDGSTFRAWSFVNNDIQEDGQ